MLEPGTGPPCDAGLEPELERLGHWMRETPDPELPTSLLERPPAPPAGRLRQTAAAGGRPVLEGEPSSAAWHRLGGRAFISHLASRVGHLALIWMPQWSGWRLAARRSLCGQRLVRSAGRNLIEQAEQWRRLESGSASGAGAHALARRCLGCRPPFHG